MSPMVFVLSCVMFADAPPGHDFSGQPANPITTRGPSEQAARARTTSRAERQAAEVGHCKEAGRPPAPKLTARHRSPSPGRWLCGGCATRTAYGCLSCWWLASSLPRCRGDRTGRTPRFCSRAPRRGRGGTSPTSAGWTPMSGPSPRWPPPRHATPPRRAWTPPPRAWSSAPSLSRGPSWSVHVRPDPRRERAGTC